MVPMDDQADIVPDMLVATTTATMDQAGTVTDMEVDWDTGADMVVMAVGMEVESRTQSTDTLTAGIMVTATSALKILMPSDVTVMCMSASIPVNSYSLLKPEENSRITYCVT